VVGSLGERRVTRESALAVSASAQDLEPYSWVQELEPALCLNSA
jgi:hypothetical protein